MLKRQCYLPKDKDRTMFSKEAAAIVFDVRELLDLPLNAEEQEPIQDGKGKSRKASTEAHSENDDIQHQREIKQMKAVLGVLHCVAISEPGIAKLPIGTALKLTLATSISTKDYLHHKLQIK